MELLTKGQFGTAGLVLYKEVFLPKRLTFLDQKIIKIIPRYPTKKNGMAGALGQLYYIAKLESVLFL